MSIIIKSGDSGSLAKVTTDGNLRVTTPALATQAGFTKILASDGNEIQITEHGSLNVNLDSLQFVEQVDGAAINTNVWMTSASGMTIAQANGFLTLNSGAAKTASAYAILTSIKNLVLFGTLPIKVSFNIGLPMSTQTNATAEWGVGLAAANSAPTDGCFFRYNASNEFRAVINYAGTETTTLIAPGTYTSASGDSVTVPLILNEAELFDIVIVEDVVQFSIADVLVATVEVPAGLAYPTNAGRLPIFARVYNGGSPPTDAPVINIGQIVAVQQGMGQSDPLDAVLSSLGRGAYQSPVTPFAQTANHANSAAPASATLSNTAAGYTTLGGRYQFAAVASAATDFALFAYQVPAGYQLFVNGVSISAAVTGVAILTATVFDWSLGVNASAVSLATADGAGTWAPRRVPVGSQGFLALAGIGQASELVRRFSTPLVVDSGRFLHVILAVPSGAATASLVFRGDVFIDGVFK